MQKLKKSKKPVYANGFLIFEALIAMAILIIIIPTAVSLGLSSQALQVMAEKELASTASAVDIISNGAVEQAASSRVRYSHEFGRSTCTVGSVFSSDVSSPDDFSKIKLYSGGIDIGVNASGTALTARNGFIYETVNSPTQSAADFFIIDAHDPSTPKLVSSLNTGPGLASIAVAGHYAYVANESSLSQLQVIDIEDRTHPVVVASLKLPLPQASTTAPHAASIFYNDGLIFLGTVKWSGDEFNSIDVTNPRSPMYLDGFNTDTLVNSVYVADSTAPSYAYVADADTDQMRVLDISDPVHVALVSDFSPIGSVVLEGKTFGIEDDSTEDSSTMLYFGRAGGGFDNPAYIKLFTFDLSRDPLVANPIHSIDIPGGVYGIVVSSGYVFLAVGASDVNNGGGGNSECGSSDGCIEIWKSDLSSMIYSLTLPALPVSLSCDHDRLYVGVASRQAFAVITFD
jgi:hypothetical protein